MKIQAAILEEINKPLVIKELDCPDPERGQVLVKILYSGVCRSQLMEVQGKRGVDRWLPHLLGHEAFGEVIAVGPEVSKVAVADNVVLTWIKGAGLDVPGATYFDEQRAVNSGPITTFSNYSIVAENRLVKSPSGVKKEIAALFGCAIPTGGGIVINELDLMPGESVAVVGLGGIGLSAFLTLMAMGCKDLTVFDTNPDKVELALRLGASAGFILGGDEPEIATVNGEKLIFDHCVEAAGTTSSIEFGFSIIKRNGTLTFASHPPAGENICLDPHELISGKKIYGTWGGKIDPDSDIEKLWRLLSPHTADLQRLTGNVYLLDQINSALADLSDGKVFRPMIKMEH